MAFLETPVSGWACFEHLVDQVHRGHGASTYCDGAGTSEGSALWTVWTHCADVSVV